MHKSQNRTSKLIGVWLLLGVFLIIVQIVLGGITRLTGSGLSITEWKPILGFIPPLNESEWIAAFEKYQQIAQFKHLNSHFTLSDFKSIFFWEWLHRLWARLLGIVFIVPFLWFLITGKFNRKMIMPLIWLFLLGALQGLIGWVMVQSGLNSERLYVSHIRLAIHFIAAMILLIYTFWIALTQLVPQFRVVVSQRLFYFTLMIGGLLILQLIYGAFMAGLKAGVFAPTWPTINGGFFMMSDSRFVALDLVNDPLIVHFIHRGFAYLIAILILIWFFRVSRIADNRWFTVARCFPLIFVTLQIGLGIWATLSSYKAVPQGWGIFEWTAQLHQLCAIFLMLSIILVAFIFRRE